MNGGIHVGGKLPAAYTATGRLFMTKMDDDELRSYIKKLSLQKYTSKTITNPEELFNKIKSERNQPYQLIEGELENNLMSIAVPIYNSQNIILL